MRLVAGLCGISAAHYGLSCMYCARKCDLTYTILTMEGVLCAVHYSTYIHVGTSGRTLSPKGVGGGILSGFTHYPHHLILNSVIHPKG